MLVMGFMALQVSLKKPVCIDSNIVQKIDRVYSPREGKTTPQVDSIYSCSQYKNPGFSSYFFENGDALNRRLNRFEVMTGRLAAGLSLSVVLDETNPQKALELKNGQISIGSARLESSELEAEILKQALLKRTFKNQPELAEAIADFMTDYKRDSNSLRQVWQMSFDQLNLFEQFSFKLALAHQLAGYTSRTNDTGVGALTDFISKSQIEASSGFKAFGKVLNDHMIRVGIVPSHQKFDIIIQVDQRAKLDLNEIKKWSAEALNLKAAVQDESGLYALPYMIRVPKDAGLSAKTDWRILFRDADFSSDPMDGYFGNTEHLVLVNSLKSLKKVQFRPMFKQGLNAFLSHNKQLNFVQFHMSSFQFRSSYLRPVKNYFTWLKDQNTNPIKQKALGWQSQFWSLELQAYKPVAVYDAIQYYRVN